MDHCRTEHLDYGDPNSLCYTSRRRQKIDLQVLSKWKLTKSTTAAIVMLHLAGKSRACDRLL